MTNRTLPRKIPVIGVPVSLTSYDEMLELLAHRPRDTATVVAVCNVHSIMEARRDDRLLTAIEQADVATSDGVPVVWALRALARRDQARVYGPDLMAHALRSGDGLRHYLYGSTPETIERLRRAIQRHAPGALVVGAHSPPFRPLTADEETAIVEDIRACRADVVWVGLGMPRQELWMHHIRRELPGVALLGVGAAFDFLSGTKRQAPSWMQRTGLEWLFRLVQEPRRLWRRYLVNNPAFVALMIRELWVRRRRAPG